MKYTNVFIDLDDTLWHTTKNSKNAMRSVFADYQFGNHFESFEAFYTIYWDYNNKLWEKYRHGEISKDKLIVDRFLVPLKGVITTPEQAKSLSDDFLERTTREKALLPNCIETLEYLKHKNYRLHILSNGFKEVQYTKMRNSGLAEYFDKIILSDDAGANKPSPKIFEYALSETGATAQESIMIGDNYDADITGAMNSGIAQIWLDLNNEAETKSPKPDHIISDLIKIKEIL